MISGARQVGKTTMLRHLADGTARTYVSLDDIAARELATQDPALFFQTYTPPILIDEVQYAPQLFPYIKMMADASDEPGAFWLTGSQYYSAMRHVQESLAGRIGLLEMLPLSQAEILGSESFEPPDFTFSDWRARENLRPAQDAARIFEHIWRGGMPGVQQANAEIRNTFFESYISSYLLRDVALLGNVQQMRAFQTFLVALAALTGQQLNYATVAESAGISQPTAKQWIKLLEGLGVVYLLPAFSSNTLKRLVRTPKLYFRDTGLASYLAGWPTPLTLQNGPSSGAFLENYVVMEFVKTYSYAPVQADLSYYRNKDGKEIDLIISQDRILHPIEVKKSASPDRREVRKFSVLDDAHFDRGPGGVVSLLDRVSPAMGEDSMIPAGLL